MYLNFAIHQLFPMGTSKPTEKVKPKLNRWLSEWFTVSYVGTVPGGGATSGGAATKQVPDHYPESERR